MSPHASLLMVMTFASVHPLIGWFRFLDPGAHNPWISVSAGVGVGYVFAYLLPKLAEMNYGLGGETHSDFIRQHLCVVRSYRTLTLPTGVLRPQAIA